MTAIDQRYLVRQRKISEIDKEIAVYARVMRSKTGAFEGVSFIRNKDKATVMTLPEAEEVLSWAASKKENAKLYVTTIICKGQ